MDLLPPTLEPATREIVLKNVDKNFNFQRSEPISAIKSYLGGFLRKVTGTEHNLRLPKTSAPISYDLHLRSNVIGESVVGEVSIKIKVLEMTDKLTLHARKLYFEELKLFDASGVDEVEISMYSLYPPTDMLTIYLAEEVAPNTELVLKVLYKFYIYDFGAMTGFYLNPFFNDGEGEEGVRR